MSVAPQSAWFDAGTLRLHYLDYGTEHLAAAEARSPLVVLHGFADSSWSWHHISTQLAAGRRVIALDHRGHGESEPGAYPTLQLAADVAALIDHLGVEQVSVLAHSLGGHAVSQLAGAMPERIDRLVMVEALGPPRPALTSDEQWRAMMRARIDGARAPAHRRVMVDVADAAARFQRQHPGLAPELVEPLVERLVRPADDGEGVVWRVDPLGRDWVVTHDHERIEIMWRGITCPVLHVLGGQAYERFWSNIRGANVNLVEAPLTDEELHRRLACFADVRHVVIDDCGHMVHYDQPEALLAAITPFLVAGS